MKKLSTIQKRENLNAIYPMDEIGNDGAHHEYWIESSNEINGKYERYAEIHFQNGSRDSLTCKSGVIDTDLLEIVRDRLKGFQSGEYSTRENALALTHIEEALLWLNVRVEDRIEREVLGTDNK